MDRTYSPQHSALLANWSDLATLIGNEMQGFLPNACSDIDLLN